MLRDASLDVYGDKNWMDAYDSDLRYESQVEQYVACLYWAVATVSTIGVFITNAKCVFITNPKRLLSS